MKTIALDAMGSDDAPMPEVAGAISAVQAGQLRVTLVGDQGRIEKELIKQGVSGLPIAVEHASETITMHDTPSLAVRRKRDSSMAVANRLVAEGKADAVVSAGNSGAMMANALLILKRLPGVDRPGILTTLPSGAGDVALLDVGANVDCRPFHLVQYAVMGQCYARSLLTSRQPRVGLLSNGAEEHKGTPLTREAHRLLNQGPCNFDYVGYVEGREIFGGDVDVVVCDGFAGNLILKVAEGVAEALFRYGRQAATSSFLNRVAAWGLRRAFRKLKKQIDYAEWGGAPLIGVGAPAFICHGASNAKAIGNALKNAADFAEHNLSEAIKKEIAGHEELLNATRGQTRSEGGGSEITHSGNVEDDSFADSGLRTLGARPDSVESGSGEDRRYKRRLDHRADGDQRAAYSC